MGTAGLLVFAKNDGLIESLSNGIEQVISFGLYLSPEVIQAALDEAGEN